MSAAPEIRLRYFDARSRAQFLRAYFTARDIEFEDDRVPLDEGFASWQAMRDNRALTGPMQRLPVLHYGDELIPETLVIAGFVHRQFGDAAALDADQNLRHDVLISVCNSDLMMPIGILLWADMLMGGVDIPTFARATLDRTNRTLDVIDKSLDEWGWVAGMRRRPVTLADCSLWEELDKQRTVFGTRFSLADKPQLAEFYEAHPARETFTALLAAHPCQITGRPGEAAAIEDIHGFVEDAEAA
jgi:glutathione S-transferase